MRLCQYFLFAIPKIKYILVREQVSLQVASYTIISGTPRSIPFELLGFLAVSLLYQALVPVVAWRLNESEQSGPGPSRESDCGSCTNGYMLFKRNLQKGDHVVRGVHKGSCNPFDSSKIGEQEWCT